MLLTIRPAADQDLPLLARLNSYLIEDAGSRNPLSVRALHRRMTKWLRADWKADVFVVHDTIAGYALYQFRPDEYVADKNLVYVRQFYIERNSRRQGLGKRAFKLLAEKRFPERCTILVEVSYVNSSGFAFWHDLGFQPYTISMLLTDS